MNLDQAAVSRFLLVFLPIFVAVDIPGVLPTYYAMTQSLAVAEKRRVARQSVLTAFSVTVAFILLGQGTFAILGVQVEDFMIAGGALLLVFAIGDLLRDGARSSSPKSAATLGSCRSARRSSPGRPRDHLADADGDVRLLAGVRRARRESGPGVAGRAPRRPHHPADRRERRDRPRQGLHSCSPRSR
jgi:hypothetical protein